MPVTSLLSQLQKDFPVITFRQSTTFYWSPLEKTVFYADPNDVDQLFHETGHAVLDHADYSRDITLLEMERDAWGQAAELAQRYGYVIDSSTIENALDSYRNWLHKRSICPKCGMTGIQTSSTTYSCAACLATWHTNDARLKGLKRTMKNSPE